MRVAAGRGEATRPNADGPRQTAATAVRAFEPLTIRVDRCKGCGLCVSVCPKHVLVQDQEAVNALGYHPVLLTDGAACTSCALCARICPDAVFAVYARPRGARR
jgi:2-oxoglutarate ferredoxin oxidoreductase subunit delta